jgi:hypothetical protein
LLTTIDLTTKAEPCFTHTLSASELPSQSHVSAAKPWPVAHVRKPCIYIIGSLRNKNIPTVGNAVRAAGFEAFDDWWGTGEKADDHWFEYEKIRGRSFVEALAGRAAQNTFALDRDNILRSEGVIMVMPAGRSGHIEFGWAARGGVPAVILLEEEPERYDVMYNFATLVTYDVQDAIEHISGRVRAGQ